MAGQHAENLMRHLKRKHEEVFQEVNERKKQRQVLKESNETSDISNFFVKSTVSVKITREEAVDACVELVTKNGRPLKAIEDSGFRKLTQPLFQAFHPPLSLNRQNIRDLIVEKAENIRNDIKNQVKNRLLSLKVDCATRLSRSIIGVNIQFMLDGKIKILTLAMREMHEVHTGANLTTVIMDILRTYDITLNQIYTLTVDNGRNIVKASELLNDEAETENTEDNSSDYFGWQYEDLEIEIDLYYDTIITLRCACHTLQLAVKDFLSEVDGNFLNLVRDVSKKLRTPTISNLLKAQNLLKPVIDCPTRWNSTFKMCERLLQLKTFCQISAHDIKELYLSPAHWAKISDFVTVLAPVHETTLKLQSADLTPSDFFLAWYTCRKKVEKIVGRYTAPLLNALRKRGENILFTAPILSCVYLDPRVQILLTSEQKECAKDHLRHLLKRNNNIRFCTVDSSSPSTNSINSSVSIDETETFLKEIESVTTKSASISNSQNNFIDSFDGVKRIPHNNKILDFWNNSAQKELKELAEIVMAVPATQVSVERSFSTLKFILSDQRAAIEANLLDDILLINLY